MIENIKNAFLSIVQNSDWMDQETKANAVKKVNVFNKMDWLRGLTTQARIDLLCIMLAGNENLVFQRLQSNSTRYPSSFLCEFVTLQSSTSETKISNQRNNDISYMNHLLFQTL